MANTVVTHGRTIITLCNWDKYQVPHPSPNPRATHEQPIKEQGNNSVAKATDKKALLDPEKLIFDSGVRLLTEAGKTEGQARSMVGKWRRDYEAEQVLHAISAAARSAASEPTSFITAVLKRSAKQASQPVDGQTRVNAQGQPEMFDRFNGWMRERV